MLFDRETWLYILNIYFNVTVLTYQAVSLHRDTDCTLANATLSPLRNKNDIWVWTEIWGVGSRLKDGDKLLTRLAGGNGEIWSSDCMTNKESTETGP
jgi:hypothetical protein